MTTGQRPYCRQRHVVGGDAALKAHWLFPVFDNTFIRTSLFLTIGNIFYDRMTGRFNI